jgi:chorismate mutase
MTSSPTTVQEARARIDEINERVVELLAERQAVVDELCEAKADAGQTVRDPEREAELLAHVRSVAEEEGLPPDLAEALFEAILKYSVQRQRRRRDDDAGTGEHVAADRPGASGAGEAWTTNGAVSSSE